MVKVQDSVIIENYSKTGNIWKTGELVGLSGQTVYERLKKLGIVKTINYWTENDSQVLLKKYQRYKELNELDVLAKELGRTKQFICRKAKELGLTNPKNKIIATTTRAKLSESTKKRIQEQGHPKGFSGHKHSVSARNKMSQRCKSAWANPNSIFNTEEFKQKKSDALHNHKMNGDYKTFSIRGNTRCVVGGKMCVFKSSWEITIAKKLQELKDSNFIQEWDYEKTHFNFDDIKRGIRSYCPDFEVTLNDNTKMYIEVKGWKMESSLLRIKMLQERYPQIKYYLIDEKEYGKILSQSDYLRRRCV